MKALHTLPIGRGLPLGLLLTLALLWVGLSVYRYHEWNYQTYRQSVERIQSDLAELRVTLEREFRRDAGLVDDHCGRGRHGSDPSLGVG